MDSEKQIKVSKFHGMGRMIARKTGYNQDFVSRVLNGKVNTDTKAGRIIKELALQLAQSIESVQVDDE
jgi:hypothetical protein